MELNQLENDENHNLAFSLRGVKSKSKQEQLVDMIDKDIGLEKESEEN